MSPYVEETLRLVTVLDYASADRLRLGDHEMVVDPARQIFVKAREDYPLAVAHMGQVLYDHAYTRGDVAAFVRAVQWRPRRGQDVPPPGASPVFPGQDIHDYPDRLLPDDFAAHLDKVHATTSPDEGGWSIVKMDGNQLSIRHESGVHAVAGAASWRGELVVGAKGRVATTRSSAAKQPGWWTLRGNEPHYTAKNPTLRLYWSLTRFGASAFVHHVSRALNERDVPFNLKLTANPQRFGRADGGVLYVATEAWPRLTEAFPSIYESVGHYLRPKVPLFTKPLAPGVGLAEDPATADGESFGMSRCRLVAEGVWDAWKAGNSTPEARLAAVRARFDAAGASLERPWLARDREDPYALRVERRAPLYAEVGA